MWTVVRLLCREWRKHMRVHQIRVDFAVTEQVKIYASQGERAWIENIDQQYQERPIPNFYKLAGKSTEVDVTVRNGDLIPLEENLNIQVISTSGHSVDGVLLCS